jgi:hypothetical protein
MPRDVAAGGRRRRVDRPTGVPLLVEAGFDAVRVSPRVVYADASRPDLVDGFTRRTFTAMIEGVRDSAIGAGLIAPERFDAGVEDLHRTTEADGVFCYTFFKGVGARRGRGSRGGLAGSLEAGPPAARGAAGGRVPRTRARA